MRSISTPSDVLPPDGEGPPTPVRGRFSDGRSAASWVVGIRIERGHLVIEPDVDNDGSPTRVTPLAWPLGAIECGEPIGSKSVDVLIHEPRRAGATVFVADPRFVRALGKAAPQLTGAVTRWKAVQPFVVLAACVAVVVGALAAIDFSPARTIAGLIPQQTRAFLGKQVVRNMVPVGSTCSTPAGKAALDRLVAKLSAAAGGGRTFEVAVSNAKVVNAFAAPGELIVLMNGLLQQAAGPDEVAGVLAHEMGHGIELHPEAGIVRTVGLVVAAELLLGGTGGGNIGSIGVGLANLSYSRSAEREADGHALAILKAARISPEGLAKFFARMERLEGGSSPVSGKNAEGKTADGKTADRSSSGGSSNDDSGFPGFELLRTHPSSRDRVKDIKAAMGTYPAVPAMDAADWAALKAICGETPRAPQPGKPSRKDPVADRPGRDI
ncbi:MAG: M48 family metallopeptidase [Hyphomicrobium aestuarii]|nr:M48 family metallopeptidase [Hyphomicrobium aestuarii]